MTRMGCCLLFLSVEWEAAGCNELTDQDDVRRTAPAINGGLTASAMKAEQAKRARRVWLR